MMSINRLIVNLEYCLEDLSMVVVQLLQMVLSQNL
jgi:hypothetical protein